MIPKKIFYVWFGDHDVSTDIKNRIMKWHSMNPDYEIIQINENNFDINSYNFTKKAYEEKNWAFVSDVARLWAIYNFGGFYFDTDVEIIKPLDNLRVNKSVFALENSDAINSGLIVAAEPQNDNLKKILSLYSHLSYDRKNLYDLTTVVIITNYFKKLGFRVKNKKQIVNGVTILPTEYFSPYHYWGSGRVTKRTIGIHHYDGSWVGKDIKMQDWHLFSYFGITKELILRTPKLFLFLQKLKHKLLGKK